MIVVNQQVVSIIQDRETAEMLAADYRKRGYTVVVAPYGLRLWEVFAERATTPEESAASSA